MNVNYSGNCRILDDRSPLAKALPDIDQVRILLEKGEDPNGPIRPPTGRPSNYATVSGSQLGCLCQYPIEVACVCGDLDLIKLLLLYGATIEKRNCLHAAAGATGASDQQKQLEVLNFLLDQGLDINKVQFQDDPDFPLRYKSKAYGTPLHSTVKWGYENRFELLFERGAKSNIQAWIYVSKDECGTVLKEECGTVWDWVMDEKEGDEGYSPRMRELLRIDRVKL